MNYPIAVRRIMMILNYKGSAMWWEKTDQNSHSSSYYTGNVYKINHNEMFSPSYLLKTCFGGI